MAHLSGELFSKTYKPLALLIGARYILVPEWCPGAQWGGIFSGSQGLMAKEFLHVGFEPLEVGSRGDDLWRRSVDAHKGGRGAGTA